MRTRKYRRFQITIKCQKEFFVVSRLFLAIIVSKTLQKTNLCLIEENGPLVNHITPFQNRMFITKISTFVGLVSNLNLSFNVLKYIF